MPVPVLSVRRALIWAAESGRGASHSTANTAPCRGGRPGAGAGHERESMVVITGAGPFLAGGRGWGARAASQLPGAVSPGWPRGRLRAATAARGGEQGMCQAWRAWAALELITQVHQVLGQHPPPGGLVVGV